MKLANNINVTVFIKPEEDENSLKHKFLELFPFNLEEEKVLLKKSKATGFNQKEIIIYEVELDKDKHTNLFLKNLKENLDEQQRIMLIRQEDRLDERLNFFLRLDKESLLQGQYEITDCGECFHIKIGVAAFPRKREVALGIVKKIFS
jgi:RNA binding exosome subunit